MNSLLNNEILHATVSRAQPTAIVISSAADGTVVDVNQSFLRLIGYDRDEVIGRSLREFAELPDAVAESTIAAGAADDSTHLNDEVTILTHDGERRRFSAATSQVEIKGQPYLISQFSDVTDVAQSESLFKSIVEQLPVIAYTHNLGDGERLTYIGPLVESILGHSPREVIGRDTDALLASVHPDDRERLVEAARQTLASSSPYRVEFRVQAADGRWIWFEDHATVLYDENGNPERWQGVLIDITARKAAEEDLRNAEARYQDLVEQSPDAVVNVSEAGIIADLNPAAERLFGYSVGEAIGQPVMMLSLPERGTEVESLLNRLNAGETITCHETVQRTKHGKLIDTWVSAAPLRDGTGRIAGSSRVYRDFTERKRGDTALRHSEERFRALVQKSSDIIVVLDVDGSRKYVSPAVERILGYRPTELIGATSDEIIHPEDIDLLRQAIAACVEGAQETPAIDLRMRHRDGSWRDFESVGTNMLNVPSVSGIVFNSRDVTSWKAAQIALRKSEELFRNAFETAPIGIALVASGGQFTRVNHALCELLGYTQEELLSKTSQEITHPDDAPDDMVLGRRLHSGEIGNYQREKRYLHKDGRVIWVLVSASAVRNGPSYDYVIAQILDITGRRHLEMDRAIMLASEREYSRQLRQLTEMRADLTAMIAHELRGPVAALRMMTHLLANWDLSAKERGEMFAAVESEIAKLDRLTSDMTAVTDAERDDFSVQLYAVPATVLQEQAVAIARTALGDRPFTSPNALKAKVWCDPERTGQVLRNLFDNAAKHTPPGTPVEMRVRRVGKRIRFEIVDHGPGIPAEDIPLIFEKFGRGRKSVDRQVPGTGIGLYLAREIVRSHGSELTLESQPGVGTTLAFELEVAP